MSGSAAAWSAWSCSSPPASDRTGLDSLRGNGSHRRARRPRRSRQEHDRLRVRRRGDRRGRGARVPARRAPGRRPRPARLQLPARRPGPRDRAHARPRGPRRRAAVRAARDPRRPGARDPPHARPRQVEARRARPDERDRAPRDRRNRSPARGGPVPARFVRMAHSIPDNVAVVLETPGGRILQTSDYKLDHTPVDGMRTRRGAAGRARQPGRRPAPRRLDQRGASGFTPSERVVGEAFRQIIPLRRGRVLVSSFASNVHRVQQAIDVAIQTDERSRSSAARCART